MDTDLVVMACVRCEDLAEPTVASERETCTRCGVPVWVDYESVLALMTDYDAPVHTVCTQCIDPGEIQGNWEFTDAQVHYWRAIGMPDDRMAQMIAVGRAGRVMGPALEGALARIKADPTGDLARTAMREYVKVMARLRSIPR